MNRLLALLALLAGAARAVDIYQYTHAGMLAPNVRNLTPRVYVPNGKDATVSVIDPATFSVIRTFKVDEEPQHVVPSHGMGALYVASDQGRQSLTPINPVTGLPGRPIPTPDPYNLYFTSDGRYAMVVAENAKELNFLDVKTMAPAFSLPVPCKGINHMDFSPDGQHVLAACEFSGDVLKIDLAARQITGKLHIGGMPQDVRISPDGTYYFVADMMKNGVHVINASGRQPREVGFIRTGKGAHGLYPSRDATRLYISNRDEGSVSVMDFRTRHLIAKWRIPGGGSPDMGSVSADGTQLWLSGRRSDVVYVFDTRSGAVIHTIRVGNGPHGLTYFPQPGRYSLGHTGNYR
ncbi:YncE family protein [Deinococcus sp. KSM4-11]|uniref:YncE family protein n=1 Tax=Deinococcus sp. KSM4-11 TaxID=2568654 RepID=UPI0010A49706|nr:YncE family protein [Deinococcus sp. KSM4-11]THF87298.1 YncE family protein [Deinococcus sp. KSM4-11]